MKEIFFSCIITCYNREALIVRAITSILSQSYQKFEIIVVDDASLDGSIASIENIKDNRIKIVRHDTNRGQNAALNSGIAVASFDYLAFLDSDDSWTPNYLLEMQQAYADNPEVAFVYCSLINSPLWTLEGENKYGEVLNQGYLSSMISITSKKDPVISIGAFDLRYSICQDDDFCFRLAKRYPFKVIKKHLAEVHGAPDSMTKNMVNVARGWEFLFNNYKKDILVFCGAKSFSRHLLNIALQYLECGKIFLGLKCYLEGISYYFSPSHNRFPFAFKEFASMNKRIFSRIKQAISS
ncbi:MAG: glycosyltransferase family 2 protein [Sphingobacteriaceae bacterium]|nr:glycosyltransferase family 2 protein [Sphingobacteriaceae bacterium]